MNIDPLEIPARQYVVKNFIDSYNRSDFDELIRMLTPDVKFENIPLKRTLKGGAQIKQQLTEAGDFFLFRELEVNTTTHNLHFSELQLTYKNILSVDIGTLFKGTKLETSAVILLEFEKAKIRRISFIPQDIWFFNAMI